MSLGKGIDSYIAYGGETAYGSAGTIDLFARIVSESLNHMKDTFRSESQDDDWHGDIYYSAGRNEGEIVFETIYTGLELFWHSLFGTYSHQSDTPVVGAHTHEFSFVPATNAFPTGITIQAVRGIASSKEMSYLGMHAAGATIEFANQQLVRTTFNMVGQGYGQGAATSPTFPTFKPVLPAHKSTLTIGGNTLSILGGTLEIQQQRPNDREHYGETLFKEPVIQGRPVATFSLNCEYNDDTGLDTQALFDDYLSENEITGLVVTHQGDIITGATQYEFSISGDKAWITGDSPAVQGPGIVPITINGEITEGLTVSLINDTGSPVT